MALTTAFTVFLAQAALGEVVTPFNNANARLGVGEGTAAFNVAQTDLQGAQKTRKVMDATFPQRSSNQMTFRSTFGTGEANLAWEEWGVFNAGSGGTMMNRKVETLGTKTSSQSWQLTVNVQLLPA